MINKIVYTLALSFLMGFSTFAQLTLDKSYDHSCISTKINETDYKLFLMDDVNNQCKIYNTDHSVYKTINLSVPSTMYLYDIRFVTQNLFDKDDLIELLYVYYQYIITDQSTQTGYYKYYTKVINENGEVLLSEPGGVYSYLYLINDTDYRLFIYGYDYSSFPYDAWTKLYKTPGDPYFLTTENEKSAVVSNAYPNPANNQVTIAYTLPENVSAGTLIISDLGGRTVKSYSVDRTFNNLQISTSDFLPGNYLYRIITTQGNTKAKKLIIN